VPKALPFFVRHSLNTQLFSLHSIFCFTSSLPSPLL